VPSRENLMKRLLVLALLVPPLAGMLAGCIIYQSDYYHHPHYWHGDDSHW
jgi:hypothetical protein